MEEYKIRMISENQNLDEKIKNLDKFLRSEESNKLNKREITLLEAQFNVMMAYSHILSMRIDNALTETEKKVLFNK